MNNTDIHRWHYDIDGGAIKIRKTKINKNGQAAVILKFITKGYFVKSDTIHHHTHIQEIYWIL
jgi:hypothetical protein